MGGEQVQAFIPHPLPPDPPVALSNARQRLLERATLALGRLDSITLLLPDPNIFLYAYVRREAVLSSQIEGTQSSLADLLLSSWRRRPACPSTIRSVDMAGEWNVRLLEDCVATLIDYRGKTPQKTLSGIPLITAKVVKGGRIERLMSSSLSTITIRGCERGLPNAGDVVITTEAPLGEVGNWVLSA